MVVLVKCWVKCTYLFSLLFLYIFPKMCTCIIITIPNFRGNLCNKYSMSIYSWNIFCIFYACSKSVLVMLKSLSSSSLTPVRLFLHVPFGVCFVVLQLFTLGSLKELAISDGGLCSLSLGCEWGWWKKWHQIGRWS